MARTLTHVIAFRVTATEYRRLTELRATFESAKWSECIRWVFDQGGVKDVINERLAQMSPAYADFSEPRARLDPYAGGDTEPSRRLLYPVDADRLDAIWDQFNALYGALTPRSARQADEAADGAT